MKNKFKLIAEYSDCIIVQKDMGDGHYKTQIRDCEGDIIHSCIKPTKDIPKDLYDEASRYSIDEIRKIKIEEELKWRKEFVKA